MYFNFLCQDAFSPKKLLNFAFCWFGFINFDLPKKLVSYDVQQVGKYVLESWRLWLYVGAVWILVSQQFVFGIKPKSFKAKAWRAYFLLKIFKT